MTIMTAGIVVLSIVLLDQVTKYYIITNTSFPVIFNYGIGLGLFSEQKYFTIFTSFLLIFVLIIFYLKKNENSSIKKTVLVLFLAGGICNLVDRVKFAGAVVDFIPFFSLTTFNIADVAIFAGVILLIYEFTVRNLL